MIDRIQYSIFAVLIHLSTAVFGHLHSSALAGLRSATSGELLFCFHYPMKHHLAPNQEFQKMGLYCVSKLNKRHGLFV
jgi:hypothetical protein